MKGLQCVEGLLLSFWKKRSEKYVQEEDDVLFCFCFFYHNYLSRIRQRLCLFLTV